MFSCASHSPQSRNVRRSHLWTVPFAELEKREEEMTLRARMSYCVT